MKQTLKYIYDRQVELMRYAETKHSIIITLSSAVIAFVSTLYSDNRLINIVSSASIVLALISIIYSFVALSVKSTKVRTKTKQEHRQNLIRYSSIIHYDENTYILDMKKSYNFPDDYKPDEFDYDLARQIIITARSVWIKFSYFNFALVFLFISVMSAIIAVWLKGNL
ncbi:MAG: hypothetical protein IJA69_04200 [Clostridia bacterium]|nr:hypothetical protein [Clostridia bacterium]